jgi:acetylglutamate kinase
VRVLVKLGGTLVDDAGSREGLAREIVQAASDPENRMVVVHGGGRQMTRFLEERGVESSFINGLRVTTPDVIDAVVKVFAGSVNTALVQAFRAAGGRPVGLTGIDAGLVDAEILNPALGQVGKPVRCDAGLLDLLADAGYLPVVACVAGDEKGSVYNVNADQMAAACAVGFRAETLLFLTDVEGVRDARGNRCSQLTAGEGETLIRDGVATGGMQAKLESAIQALRQGVGEIRIAAGAETGLAALLHKGNTAGTRIIP